VDEQLNYFIKVIKEADETIKNVFIFSHKLLWTVKTSKYQVVYKHLNSQNGYQYDSNFLGCIIPVLNDLAKDKNVFWISGDIGCSWSLPLFYDKDSSGITFIATGLGDTGNDIILDVNINHGNIKIQSLSLGHDMDFNDIEKYNLEYWENYFHYPFQNPFSLIN
jgi:hypothetical protein